MADPRDDVYGRLDAWLERPRDAAFPYQPPPSGAPGAPDTHDDLPRLTDLLVRGHLPFEMARAPATAPAHPPEYEALLAELEAELLVRFRSRMQLALLQSAEDIAERLSRELSRDLLERLKSLLDNNKP